MNGERYRAIHDGNGECHHHHHHHHHHQQQQQQQDDAEHDVEMPKTASSSIVDRDTEGHGSVPNGPNAFPWRSNGMSFQRVCTEDQDEENNLLDEDHVGDDDDDDDDEDDEDDEDDDDDDDCAADDKTQRVSNVLRKEMSTTRSRADSPSSRHSSFDLDDDEDDLGIGRFNLDFSNGAGERTRTPRSVLDESVEGGTINLRLLWTAFAEARHESRRRRVERLLSANSEMERARLSASSWCDLRDRGIFLLMGVSVVWVSACVLLHSIIWILFGLLALVCRVLWLPGYWFVWGRHVERKRQQAMEIYDEINARGLEIASNNTTANGDGGGGGGAKSNNDNERKKLDLV